MYLDNQFVRITIERTKQKELNYFPTSVSNNLENPKMLVVHTMSYYSWKSIQNGFQLWSIKPIHSDINLVKDLLDRNTELEY